MTKRIQTATGWLPIRTLKPGEKVSENGAYDLSMERYHDPNLCIGPSISSSGLRLIEKKSPAHFYDVWAGNPDRDPEADDELESKEGIRLGRATHDLYFEGEEAFRERSAIRPDEFKDFRTKAAQEWRDAQLAAGKNFLSDEDVVRVRGMVRALDAHPLTGELDGHVETSLIWKDPRTGIWLKSRPDVLPRGSNVAADLKCLRDVSDEALQRAIYVDARYDMQKALVNIGRMAVLGLETEEHVLICVESKRPHVIRSAPIPTNEIEDAKLYLRRSINTFAKCLKEGVWPGFEQSDDMYLGRPDWARKRLENEIKYSLLPERF